MLKQNEKIKILKQLCICRIFVLMYLGWLQKQLVEVSQMWFDGQQNAAINSVTSLKSLSIHYTIHPVINTDQTHKIKQRMDEQNV